MGVYICMPVLACAHGCVHLCNVCECMCVCEKACKGKLYVLLIRKHASLKIICLYRIGYSITIGYTVIAYFTGVLPL